MEFKIYKDPDIIKMEEIIREMNSIDLPHGVMKLLSEYHNAISIGICPNFVRKYYNRMNELEKDQ